MWESNKDKYSNGIIYKLGKYKVAEVYYNSGRSKDDNENIFVLSTSLPGLKQRLGLFKTLDLAKDYFSKVLEMWLKNTGLNISYTIKLQD